jgi:AraC-like DNA-binding protein
MTSSAFTPVRQASLRGTYNAMAFATVSGEAAMDLRVRKALQLVVAGLTGGKVPPLDAVSRAVNLSRSRVRHLFKAEVGTSFGEYVRPCDTVFTLNENNTWTILMEDQDRSGA